MRRRLIAGNWKMNGVRDSLTELDPIVAECETFASEVLICPPATLLPLMANRLSGSGVMVGAQDCHPNPAGAHTGDLSAPMLADAGASHVILGHSERRTQHGETDSLVNAKASATARAGLVPIICVGETRGEREAGIALDIVAGQVRNSVPAEPDPEALIVAYEPVWAIGTGLVPSLSDIAEMHAHIRSLLRKEIGESGGHRIRILYGGSVNAGNAHEILSVANVDGGLVGGASLKARDFLPIIRQSEAG